ncbi:RNA methyltransferase [Psychrosphaera sp. B3R10]|uniref:RNA methyltransferase n=1 Tax=unclassified Psychrosphaera TaxID=2641570 RepID=UPI001C0A50F6|nr:MULTISPECIES: RNA methyltransferase [unclassified Psychrosphaera]MBU2882806.1 RNA methyltransferase [Psychrosphaera sp. I2R16]MBU2988044.1 RNA methyltransferase [Psychrosphaera sp. B3R10]
MLSKNQMKLARSLGQKKFRKSLGQFLVQGEKNVLELLQSTLKVDQVFATDSFVSQHETQIRGLQVTVTDEVTLSKISTLAANNTVIAIVTTPPNVSFQDRGLTIALDGVSDPGNLGTIIRVADWYGIQQVVLGTNCADPYNPKTISATMGSFTRVEIVFANLAEILPTTNRPVYGAFLEGENLHQATLSNEAIIVMGSESHGISREVAAYINKPITIPRFGFAESLNVAMATGIILDNFIR